MKVLGDWVLYLIVVAILTAGRVVPYRVKTFSLLMLLRIFIVVKPRYKEIALINIRQVFKDKDDSWHQQLLDSHLKSLAAIITDFSLLPFIDKQWVSDHVKLQADAEEFQRIKSRKKPLLMAAGHLGSFELMPAAGSVLIEPISYVVRQFKNPLLDKWWNSVRERLGNRVISRKGAVKGILREISKGVPVAFLFDQNVVRNNAVFVDFFGRPAATTAALGTVSLRTGADIMLATLENVGQQQYVLKVELCEVQDVYDNDELSSADKVREITQRVTRRFEDFVLANPSAWLWFHRRWKTRPENSDLAHLYDPSKN